MASSKKKREITPDPNSFDSFPVLVDDGSSIDSDDVVTRAVKKRKLEEATGKKHRSIFQSSQSSQSDTAAGDTYDVDSTPQQTATMPIQEKDSVEDTVSISTKEEVRCQDSLDLLSDPSFSFPPGPIREDSLPMIITYLIDDDD